MGQGGGAGGGFTPEWVSFICNFVFFVKIYLLCVFFLLKNIYVDNNNGLLSSTLITVARCWGVNSAAVGATQKVIVWKRYQAVIHRLHHSNNNCPNSSKSSRLISCRYLNEQNSFIGNKYLFKNIIFVIFLINIFYYLWWIFLMEN